MPDLPDDIARINALTTNARNTWFALLGVLVFVGITLMGVEHIDFYGVDRATRLPLVNVEVPTRYFFIAAPILTAAIYGYFHLYLIRLWDVLGKTEARHDGLPLGDVVAPWLVTDAALHLRRRLRRDFCTTPRIMEGPAMALNFLLAWGFGPIVLGFLWWQSMPARAFWSITIFASAALIVVLFTGAASLVMSVLRMRPGNDGKPVDLWSTIPAMTTFLIIAPAILLFAYQRTEGATRYLAGLDLTGEEIVERPDGWLPYAVARDEFRADWCGRKGIGAKDCQDLGNREPAFDAEWQTRRRIALTDMRRPDWHKPGRPKPDFRKARLDGSFLAGADLRGAQLQGADLIGAQMQGAELSGAQMQEAIFNGAQMQGAILSSAQLQGAIFSGAEMQEAELWDAQLQGADLRRAEMRGADLSGAQMQGADLRYVHLTGSAENSTFLHGTNLSAATTHSGALRFVDVSAAVFDGQTDFRNAFLDGSVNYTKDFALQMAPKGRDKPCQWAGATLSDEDFYARWRWWIEADPGREIFVNNWRVIAPPEWRDVRRLTDQEIADLGLADCHWQTGPMPGAEDAE